jgi:site-specific DNA-methyltransferase (adenine-specific)
MNQEEIVDNIILDMIDLERPGRKEKILNNTTKSSRRLPMLSMLGLDANKSIFMDYKALVLNKSSYVCGEYATHIVQLIGKYVNVADTEVKKYGEVMTPLTLVNEMLDTLPNEVWSNPNLKWLDPCNGIGTFPSVIVERLMVGLKDVIIGDCDRYRHIIENMIYVCEIQAKNMFLFHCAFDREDNHKLNTYCGSFLDEKFDEHMKNVWEVEKFDIVVGNPPYNEAFSNSGTAKDLFDKFIFKSLIICNKLLFITPTRWFSKHSLVKLRNTLLGSNKIKLIKHYHNSKDVFQNAEITGGVSYFLYDNDYNSNLVNFNGEKVNLSKQVETFGMVLYNQEMNLVKNIIDKLPKERLSKIFKSKGYFGIKTNGTQMTGNIICYFSNQRGVKMNMETKNGRYYSYVNDYTDNGNVINDWKVITSSAYGANPNGIGEINLINPNEICSESFIFFNFKTKKEATNFISYINTNFVKFLISIKKNKQDVTSIVFELVPQVPLDREWTDEQLYEYFKLTQEEINLIESQKK